MLDYRIICKKLLKKVYVFNRNYGVRYKRIIFVVLILF